MLLLLPLLPLVAAIGTPLLARRLGRHAGWLPASVSAGLAVWIIALLVGGAASAEPLTLAWSWVPALGVDLSLRLDALALAFALVVTVVGTGVFTYAIGYLDHDRAPGRVMAWLALFQAAMLALVMADNAIWLFVCWEVTTLCSFMLVGHTGSDEARSGAREGLLVTALGGLALLLGLLLIGTAAGTLSLSTWAANPEVILASPLAGAGIIAVVVAALTKSAQWPFHFWLPQAMAAPAPVSAFLHSAALVKAGVFLLLRLQPALGEHVWWQTLLIAAGGITAVVGGMRAIGRHDLKATLAATTSGALGLIVLMVGIGGNAAIAAAVTLVIAHAGYKSTMFLVAGAVDHACHNRDPEALGGLRRHLPWTWAAALIGGVGLAGLIPSGGFVAKEIALKAALGDFPIGVVVIVIAGAGFAIAAATVALKPFLGAETEPASHAHEARWPMRIGMLIAGIFGLTSGVLIGVMGPGIIVPAAQSAGAAEPMVPKLWYGITLALGLSVLALVLAAVAWKARLAIAAGIERYGVIVSARGWQAAWSFLLGSAGRCTSLVQNGSLQLYVATVLLTTIGLVAAASAGTDSVWSWPTLTESPSTAAAVAFLLIAGGALATALSRDRLAAIVALGATGAGMTLFFIATSAPDLATTQFLVECLTVILLVAAFRNLPRKVVTTNRAANTGALLLAILVGTGAFVVTMLARGTTAVDPVSGVHGALSMAEAYGRNVVNVILVDFRALDTLGEITVLGIAAMAVVALLTAMASRSASAGSSATTPATKETT